MRDMKTMTSELKYFEAQLQHHANQIKLYGNWIVEHQKEYDLCEQKIQEIKQRNEEDMKDDNN